MTIVGERVQPSRDRRGLRTTPRQLGSCALAVAAAALAPNADAADPAATPMLSYAVVADGIPAAFAAAPGDAARGRTLVAARDPANCVLCHSVPDASIRFAGDVGPPLAGVGARLDTAQLRLRVVDNLRVNARTIMPSYYKVDGLDRVAPAYRGKPVLTAQEVEDVVAYLGTLR
jgi:sulfur-oxidizing protein SoxX